jgi:tetratricopeptide (TPR) repeat protein
LAGGLLNWVIQGQGSNIRFTGLRLNRRDGSSGIFEKIMIAGERKSTQPLSGMRTEKRATSIRMAAAMIRWQWLPMLLAAPFFALPSPWPLIPVYVVPALWLAIWLAGGEPLVQTPLNIPILGIAMMILVSTWASYDLKQSIGYIAGAVLGLGAFFTVARYGETAKGWWLCFFFYTGINLFLAGVVSLMVKWPQKISLLAPLTSHLTSPVITLSKLSETPHPNSIPVFLLGVLPLLMVLTASTLIQRKQWATIIDSKRLSALTLILAALTGAGSFMLLLSQSRGGYISFAITCLFLLLVVLPPRSRWRLLTGVVLAALVIVVLWQRGVLSPVRASLGSLASTDPAFSLDSLQGRLEIWPRAIYGIRDFPITGMGMDTFGHVLPVLYPLVTVSPELVTLNAHNTYLQAALDLGLPGLIAFLGVQVGTLWMLLKLWRTVHKWQDIPQFSRSLFPPWVSGFPMRVIVLGLGGGLIAYLVFGLAESLGLGVYILIWTLIGLIAGLFRQIQPARKENAWIGEPNGGLPVDPGQKGARKAFNLELHFAGRPVRIRTAIFLLCILMGISAGALIGLKSARQVWQINAWSVQFARHALNPALELPLPGEAPAEHPRAVFWLASDALQSGDPALADRLISSQAAQGDSLALQLMAKVRLAQGDFPGALLIWQQTGDVPSLLRYASQALQAGRLEQAFMAYEAAWKVDPEAGTLPLVDFLVTDKQDYAGAENVLRISLAPLPRNSWTWSIWSINLGNVLRAQKRWDEAVSVYESISFRAQYDWEVHLGLGWAKYERGDGLQATMDEFQKVIDSPESRGNGQLAMAMLLSRESRFEQADRWYEQALVLNPDDRWFFLLRGDTALQAGNTGLALSVFQEALERFPDFAPAYSEIAYAYQLSGQPDQAIAAIQQALARMTPPNADYYARAGNIYEWHGEESRAIQAYRQALVIDPKNPTALAGLERLNK